jgi:hypothetical protein
MGGSLTSVRLLALSILVLTATFVQAANTQGTYHPDAKTSDSWTINEHSTLVWDGKPYLPVGTIVDSPAAVDRAVAAGITDFVVDLPASGTGWEETLASLNQHHARFLLRVNSLAPMATGVAVEPQGYRVSGIKEQQTVHISLPGIQSAFVVVALRRDGSIIESKRVPVTDGLLNYTVEAPGGLERVLLIYPVTTSAELPDYWEALDKHRDELLQSIKRHAPGPGLRGIVDPFGRTLVLPGKELRFVPTSPYFHDELRDYLIDQYKALETAERTWAMGSNDLKDFDTMARLVPLWSGSRGVSDFWDPQTNRLYPCDNRRSRAWTDITIAVESAGARRYLRILNDLHSLVDVPVVQQWAGWAAAYETETPSLDGIGMRTVGTGASAIYDTGGRAASSILRWKRPGWFPATEVELGPAANVGQLAGVIDDVTGVGARGVFVRADSPEMLKAIGVAAAAPVDASLAESSPHAIFFPENALNPAQIQRLPGGTWSLPSPMDGDRVDLGTKYAGYRYVNQGKKTFALYAMKPGRVKLYMSNPKLAVVTTLDGTDSKPKIDRGYLEIQMGVAPVIITGIDETPVPEDALKETMDRFVKMSTILEQAHQEAPEELYNFQEAFTQLKVSPGLAFAAMRAAYRSLSGRIGRFDWIEAETCRDNNFSEIDDSPACSGGAALALRTQLPPGPAGYYANFQVQVKSPNDQEVWLAARIPPDRRGDIQVIIGGQSENPGVNDPIVGGQTLTINTDPVSPYGNGFAWYKLGVTKLAGGQSTIKLVVTGETSSDLAIDVLLLTPGVFHPNGVDQPDAMDFSKPVTPVKKPKQQKGRNSGSSGLG